MPSQYRDDDDGPTRDIPSLTDDETDVESQNRDLQITSDSPASESNTAFPVPVWMRESAKSFRYKWVPAPVRQSFRAVAQWIQGPDPPRVMRIKPFFPTIQEAPLRLMDRFVPKRRHRICLLAFVHVCWFLTWSLMVRHNSTAAYIKGYGKPQNLWCGASLWYASRSQADPNVNDNSGEVTTAVGSTETTVAPFRPIPCLSVAVQTATPSNCSIHTTWATNR